MQGNNTTFIFKQKCDYMYINVNYKVIVKRHASHKHYEVSFLILKGKKVWPKLTDCGVPSSSSIIGLDGGEENLAIIVSKCLQQKPLHELGADCVTQCHHFDFNVEIKN